MSGLATIAPFGFSFEPVRLLAAYRRLGATSCQFYRNPENPPSIADALKASNAAGVPFDSIHGVFGYDIDPSSPVAEHRRHCLGVYEAEGRLARDLGGPMVVVHPAAWTPGRAIMVPAEARASDAYRRPFLAEFLRALAETGERLGVTYLVENQPWNCYAGADPAALAQDVLAVGSRRIAMCLDTGHAHITTRDVPGAIRAAASTTLYFHIHDNDGTADDHRMPGDGTIDWAEVARALSETGADDRAVRMLEVFYEESRVEAMERDGLARRLGHCLALS